MVESTRKLLLVDDEEVFCKVLAQALTHRGFAVTIAHDCDQATRRATGIIPDDAVVDLRIGTESGLTLIPALKGINPDMRILVLTGYASIATAVEAIKLGATHYLSKPVDADDIVTHLNKQAGNPDTPVAHNRMSVDRMEWEYIQKTLAEHNGNISAAARALKMHRRTLQRKLAKHPYGEDA